MRAHPSYNVPPPPKIKSAKITQQLQRAKADGDAKYRANAMEDAVRLYSLAIGFALSRPPWESTVEARDEIAPLLNNRSAAHSALGHHAEALADVETSMKIKKFW